MSTRCHLELDDDLASRCRKMAARCKTETGRDGLDLEGFVTKILPAAVTFAETAITDLFGPVAPPAAKAHR